MSDIQDKPQKDMEISLFGLFCLLLLVASVMGSALGVIVSAFENRRHLAELETLRADARDMQVLWGQYLVEKSTWAAYGRIHDMALNGLEMQAPRPDQITVVKVQ
ncbi:MAG TPA: cell division protein FtsL [Pseudomonadales bacterium]|nr:cell division protein FtsL [Pseudomonadales bacterium]